MRDKFLKRLNEMLEFQWNDYDIKIQEEYDERKGVRHGEKVLEAIARNMEEVMFEEDANMIVEERLNYHEFEDTNRIIRSVLIPNGWVLNDPPSINCPRCKTKTSGLANGQVTVCLKCRLTMHRVGNILKIRGKPYSEAEC